MTQTLRSWMTLCELEIPDVVDTGPELIDPIDDVDIDQPAFKMGDWVYSDIAKDTSQIVARNHDPDDDSEFYTLKWQDGSETEDVPASTLRLTSHPSHPDNPSRPPEVASTPPPRHPFVANVIKGRKPVTIAPSESIATAAYLIAKNNVGALPVMSDSTLIGILSERDIICKVVSRNLNPATTPVAEIMTRNPITIASDDQLLKALELMSKGGFRHLPITDDGNVVGILSLRDAIRPALRRM